MQNAVTVDATGGANSLYMGDKQEGKAGHNNYGRPEGQNVGNFLTTATPPACWRPRVRPAARLRSGLEQCAAQSKTARCTAPFRLGGWDLRSYQHSFFGEA